MNHDHPTAPACDVCAKPVDDPAAYVCRRCAEVLGEQLTSIVEFTPDARAVAARQIRRGTAVGAPGGGNPLPLDLGTGARLDAAQNALTTWVRHVADERGLVVPTGQDHLVVAARWLAEQIEWIRHRVEGKEFARDVAAAARLVASLADRPAERRYAGPCSTPNEETGEQCGTDLYARPGTAIATCRVCGYEYDVAEQQEWMFGQVRDYLARPVEIAGILTRLGVQIGYSTIAAYAQHGQITAHGSDQRGRPLFRIGDVVDVRTRAGRPVAA